MCHFECIDNTCYVLFCIIIVVYDLFPDFRKIKAWISSHVCYLQLWVRPVHTALEEFKNAAFFLRLDLPSTLIRHENEAFRKRSSKGRNLKTSALPFSVCRETCWTGALFSKTLTFASNTNPNWPAVVASSNLILQRSVDGKYLIIIRFRVQFGINRPFSLVHFVFPIQIMWWYSGDLILCLVH